MMLQTQNPPHWSLYKNINNITILSYLLLRLVTSLAHPKKGTTKNAQKTPNFDFSQGRDLRQFSLLMFPYLHAKNQRICRFRSQAIWQSVHFWAIFDPKCPKKPQFWIFQANRALSLFLTSGPLPSCQKSENSEAWLRLGSCHIQTDIHTDIHSEGIL